MSDSVVGLLPDYVRYIFPVSCLLFTLLSWCLIGLCFARKHVLDIADELSENSEENQQNRCQLMHRAWKSCCRSCGNGVRGYFRAIGFLFGLFWQWAVDVDPMIHIVSLLVVQVLSLTFLVLWLAGALNMVIQFASAYAIVVVVGILFLFLILGTIWSYVKNTWDQLVATIDMVHRQYERVEQGIKRTTEMVGENVDAVKGRGMDAMERMVGRDLDGDGDIGGVPISTTESPDLSTTASITLDEEDPEDPGTPQGYCFARCGSGQKKKVVISELAQSSSGGPEAV